MCRTFGMYGGEDKCMCGFRGEAWRKETMDDLGLDRSIIKWFLQMEVGWIIPAQYRDRWQVAVKTEMKLQAS